MKSEKKDIVVIGSMLSNDVILASHLLRYGYKTIVARPKAEEVIIENSITKTPKDLIFYYNNKFQLLKTLYNTKIIICISGAILLYLKQFFLIYPFLRLPKFINIPTGSDFTELATENSIRGYLYRKVLRRAKVNLIGTYPNKIKTLIKLKNINFHFSRFPYKTNENKKLLKVLKKESPIIFFHPSNIDWNADNVKSRNSTKGSNKFIKAFIKALKDGLNAKCIILDRGIDKEKAKLIISKSGASEHFIWKEDLSREEFFTQVQQCDVVVDQFSGGAYGGIAVESMSYGKPVFCHIHKPSARLLYFDDLPPVFNCYSEKQIYKALHLCQDREYLYKKGKQSQDWAYRNHNWKFYLIQINLFFDILTENSKSKFLLENIDEN